MLILKNFLNFLFPPACVTCQQEGSLFCPSCQNKIDFLYFTPRLKNLEKYHSDLQVLSFYTDPLASVIKAYKYQGLYHLAPILAQLLYKHLIFSPTIDYLTFIPLHPKKQRQRGFNQTELIAKELSLIIHRPVINLFSRRFHTQSLASTTKQKDREKVTQNVFNLQDKNWSFLQHQELLILDDVVTSGSTFTSCLKLLSALNLSKIQLMTLAHEG